MPWPYTSTRMAVESTGTNGAAAVCLAAGAKLQADMGSDKESTVYAGELMGIVMALTIT